MMGEKPKVLVGMSGGVDSSVAALLLQQQGFSVVGVMLRLWSPEGCEGENRCCTPASMQMARDTAQTLGIPFYVVDVRDQFYRDIVQPFISDYLKGLTPNPCLHCNMRMRWGFLLNYANAIGAKYLATGHYARIIRDATSSHLLKAVDAQKDQSYVLSGLNQEQLGQTLLPLGEFTKSEIRKIARNSHLHAAETKDSQDLCFLGGGDYREFLRSQGAADQEGDILDVNGNVVGTHTGIWKYTLGQRKGLRIANKEPLYITQKNIHNNTLTVSTKQLIGKNSLTAEKVNWIQPLQQGISTLKASAKIRYQADEVMCDVTIQADAKISIKFPKILRDITPGQWVALYNGEECLGGGIITQAEDSVQSGRK